MDVIFRGERPEKPQPGDAYWAPEDECGRWSEGRLPGAPFACWFTLTEAWERAGRRPLVIVLPCGFLWVADSLSSRDENEGRRGEGAGWQVLIHAPPVVGEKLKVEVHPSVDIGHGWHGWIGCNTVGYGEMSADVDGKTFPRAP